MSKTKNIAIIVAGGKGKRMNADISKQFLPIGGKAIIVHTIEKFEKCEFIDLIVVVSEKDGINYFKKIIDENNFKKTEFVIEGGKERQYSVFNALLFLRDNKISNENDIILIHDGVRPFVKYEEIKNVIKCLENSQYDGCVLGVKTKDTIKECDSNGVVKNTPDRKSLWNAATPQAFRYSVIMKAYEKAFRDDFIGTDDSSLAERNKAVIKMIEGSYENIKITTKDDLMAAESFIKQ